MLTFFKFSKIYKNSNIVKSFSTNQKQNDKSFFEKLEIIKNAQQTTKIKTDEDIYTEKVLIIE